MARGQRSEIGSTRTSPNGYHYTRTADRGWLLTHRLVAEELLGRPLADNERIRFRDGDRENRTPDNIEVYVVKQGTKSKRLSAIDAKIAELQERRKEILAEED